MQAHAREVATTRQRTLASYVAYPRRLESDANHAASVASDYGGRWLLEALQNAEDAAASNVWACTLSHFLAIADDGNGFPPQAVESISLPHVSPKSGLTIGRKGLGFRSVYEVSDNPMVAVRDQDGWFAFGFDEAKARQAIAVVPELAGYRGPIPYQYLPFDAAADAGGLLSVLPAQITTAARTIILLPYRPGFTAESAWSRLQSLQETTVLALHSISRFTAVGLTGSFHLAWDRSRDGRVSVTDSRRGTTITEWIVRRQSLQPPPNLLESVTDTERVHLGQVEVLAALQKAGPDTSLPVHVYFPTEDQGPCQLLLHGDFLLESNRKHIHALDANPFNAWLATNLAACAVDLVSQSVQEAWAADDVDGARRAILALAPVANPSGVTKGLVAAIQVAAQTRLRLPGNAGTVEGSGIRTLDSQARHAAALEAALTTGLADSIVARQLLDSKVASALKSMGLKPIGDAELRSALSAAPTSVEVAWVRWTYLVAWAHADRRSLQEALPTISAIPVLPFQGWWASLKDAGSATLSVADTDEILPDWLKIHFVDAEWVARRRVDPEKDRSDQVLKVAGVYLTHGDAVTKGLEAAMDKFWASPGEQGKAFTQFLLAWGVGAQAFLKDLKACPVPTTNPGKPWARADAVYFGSAWGNTALESLCGTAVHYVAKPEAEADAIKALYEALGVVPHPRILVTNGDAADRARAAAAAGLAAHQVEHVDVMRIDGIGLPALDEARSAILLTFIGVHWDSYYAQYARTSPRYRKKSWVYSNIAIQSTWMGDLKRAVKVPMVSGLPRRPIDECFVSGESIPAEIARFLPAIDAVTLGDDAVKGLVKLGARASADEIQAEDLRRAYLENLPSIAGAMSERDVERAYHYLLEWVERGPPAWFGPGMRLLTTSNGDVVSTPAKAAWLLDHPSREAFLDLPHLNLNERLRAKARSRLEMRSLARESRFRYTAQDDDQGAALNLRANLRPASRFLLAWMFDTDRDHQAASNLLNIIAVRVTKVLSVEASIDGTGWRPIKDDHVWDATAKQVVVRHSESAATMQSALARGVVEALELPSSMVSFLRALLAHRDDDHRLRELIEQGVPDTALTFGAATGTAPVPPSPSAQKPDEAPSPSPSPDSPPAQDSDSAGPAQGEPPETPRDGEDNEAARTPDAPVREAEVNLKSPEEAAREAQVVDELPPPPPPTPPGGGDGGQRSLPRNIPEPEPEAVMTKQQRLKIEAAGRSVCTTLLERQGYTVQPMALDHPGYDLLASKPDATLRVEVKAHLGLTYVVDVSARQILEMGTPQPGSSWELWNVCNLGEGRDDVVVHVTSSIPEEVLRVSAYRVDLRRCSLKAVI